MNLQNGELIVYKSAGVCRVVAQEEQSMDGIHSVLYYKLKPIADQNSTYYVPVASAGERLRRLMTKEEVLALIDTMPLAAEEENELPANRRKRRELYAQVIKEHDEHELVRMLASLYEKKQSSEAKGKRISAMDETAMKNAEELMFQEIGVVLELERAQVRAFIDERVQNTCS